MVQMMVSVQKRASIYHNDIQFDIINSVEILGRPIEEVEDEEISISI